MKGRPKQTVEPDSDRIRAFRNERGFTQEQLVRPGLSLSVIKKIERGDGVQPETIDALAAALGVQYDELVKPGHRRSAAVPVHTSQDVRIAVDTTLLLSADSYLGCFSVRDNRALSAFSFIVSVFCGCEHLYFKKPPRQPPLVTPLLWLFWQYASGKPRDIAQTMPVEVEQAPLLIEPFSILLREPDLPQWARLQLSDSRMDAIYWGSGTPLESLQISHKVLTEAGTFEQPSDLISTLRHDPGFSLATGAAEAARHFGGVLDYATTYTFSVMARAKVYAFAVEEGHAYEPGWVRRVALNEPALAIQTHPELLNWGWILSQFRGIAFPFPLQGDSDEKYFRDCLFRLRQFTLNQGVPVTDLRGNPSKVRHYLKSALEEAGFANIDIGMGQLVSASPSVLRRFVGITPVSELAAGQGGYSGLRYIRSQFEDVVEAITLGKEPKVNL